MGPATAAPAGFDPRPALGGGPGPQWPRGPLLTRARALRYGHTVIAWPLGIVALGPPSGLKLRDCSIAPAPSRPRSKNRDRGAHLEKAGRRPPPPLPRSTRAVAIGSGFRMGDVRVRLAVMDPCDASWGSDLAARPLLRRRQKSAGTRGFRAGRDGNAGRDSCASQRGQFGRSGFVGWPPSWGGPLQAQARWVATAPGRASWP